MVPPPFGGNNFDGTESMYIPSGAAVIDSADIEDGSSSRASFRRD